MSAMERLTEHVNSVEEHSWRRTVPVDPHWLDDALDDGSFQVWSEAEQNEDPWYLRETE